MERARRTAAIMPDWLEFDPPGVESNRPTMLTEEKKRREGGGEGGPPRPILSLFLSPPFRLSFSCESPKEGPGHDAEKRSPTRSCLCTCAHGNTVIEPFFTARTRTRNTPQSPAKIVFSNLP